MDWIKKNPAQLTLGVAALLGLAATVMLWMKVSAFDANFDSSRGGTLSNAPVEKLNVESLDAARKAVTTPAKWDAPEKEGSRLFVSKLYVLRGDKLEQTKDKIFHPPVANNWLEKFSLNVLSPSVLNEDPDGDGFTTLEEWNGLDGVSHLDMNGEKVMGPDGQPLPADSTDPTKADSHPPYHTKLELAKVVYIPFRLKFMSYDYNPAKPQETTVAINTVDRGGRTHFKPIGDDIPGTKFKIESFKEKYADGADGTKVDVSEVTVKNKETGVLVVLPLKQVVDSPDSYGIFSYKWVKAGGQKTADFPKRRGETFTLQPEPDKIFKLLEIQGKKATLEMPDGTTKTLTSP